MKILPRCLSFVILLLLILDGILFYASAFFASPGSNRLFSRKLELKPNDKDDDAVIEDLMRLAMMHFCSQALYTIVKLRIPDIVGNETKTIHKISLQLEKEPNKDALLRTMRLLASQGIFEEEKSSSNSGECAFSLTGMGKLLQTTDKNHLSLASMVLHWMERPLWDAWAELSGFVANKESKLPFVNANGMSSDDFYSQNMESLRHANGFVRFISEREIQACVDGFDWGMLSGKTVVDLGGYQGAVMGAVARKFPNIKCLCLDRPEVIASTPEPLTGVELVVGDMFEPDTIPSCDAIFMKHIVFCDWDEEKSMEILKSCYKVLKQKGKVIIGEAILPDAGEVGTSARGQLPLFLDALMMLVGRKTALTESQWAEIAKNTGFKLQSITATSSPSCHVLVLEKSG